MMLMIFIAFMRIYYMVYLNYDPRLSESGLEINNLSILEDLALVRHVFCDKTGTLTKNQLSFKEMSYVGNPLS